MKDKIRELIKNNKNLLGLLCLFIIIQPILDINCLFRNKNLQLFGFTIPTLVRCLFIGILTLITIKNAKNKKNYIYISIYFGVILVYTIIHHLISSDQNIVIPTSYAYSLFSELFYIIRMILPLTIIYFTKKSNVDYQKFSRTILVSSFIIGFVIFIGNTLCISYTSYETKTNITTLNWIGWLFNDLSKYNYNELTSKGWFYMANQVSGLMILLLPFCLYDVLKKTRKFNIITSFLLIISMIMIGTRTAAYGWILIYICLIIVLFYLRILKKETWWNFKRLIPFLLILVIGIFFLAISPINNRKYGYKLGDLNSLGKKPSDDTSVDIREKYILDSYKVFGIQERYVKKLYNYKFDSDFWFNVFELSKKNGVIENREMQTLISNRIDELNGSKLKYKLFGYSFSRMRNGGIYMEHDFIVQAFTMGYIGLILLVGPYIAIMVLVSLKILKKLKNQPKLISITFVIAICALLGVSVFSGHILDELFVTIYLGFICGFFWKTTNIGEVKFDEKEC